MRKETAVPVYVAGDVKVKLTPQEAGNNSKETIPSGHLQIKNNLK
jgi:hypothetical protein